MFQAFEELLRDQKDARAKCIYASDTLKELLESILSKLGDLKERIELVPNSTVVKASSVLTSSGTMSLNCALAGIPGAVVYRIHPLTYLFGKMVLKIPYIGIANILLHQAFYPEFIQGAAKARVLADELLDCLNNASRIEKTRELSGDLRSILDKPASGGVGAWLNENVSKERS
jgi:lipid-A-disaccharide synthase